MGEVHHMEPDNYPSVDSQPLAGEELDAKAHWERFQPSLVKQLRAKGGEKALDTAIRAAWWRKEYGILLEQVRNPALHPSQVKELFQDELYPPPETKPATRTTPAASPPTTS